MDFIRKVTTYHIINYTRNFDDSLQSAAEKVCVSYRVTPSGVYNDTLSLLRSFKFIVYNRVVS